MSRKRAIVCIGEALLCEFPDRTEPGGLALSAAMAAASAGHSGIAVSRVGQDAAGTQIVRAAHEAGVEVTHVQTDPDLPTGRQVIRSVGGRVTSSITPSAAFDNLQWDFDMVDVAQHADAVVFGHMARRGGQTRSVIKQFLAECQSALRLFDLTNRNSEGLDRSEAWSGLEFAEIVVGDDIALRSLSPTSGGEVAAAARELARSFRVQVVVAVHRDAGSTTQRFSAHTDQDTVEMKDPFASARHGVALVGLLSGLLAGADLISALQAAHDAATCNVQ
jgi:sugar/nucleoside kinase (ribokinase family)